MPVRCITSSNIINKLCMRNSISSNIKRYGREIEQGPLKYSIRGRQILVIVLNFSTIYGSLISTKFGYNEQSFYGTIGVHIILCRRKLKLGLQAGHQQRQVQGRQTSDIIVKEISFPQSNRYTFIVQINRIVLKKKHSPSLAVHIYPSNFHRPSFPNVQQFAVRERRGKVQGWHLSNVFTRHKKGVWTEYSPS